MRIALVSWNRRKVGGTEVYLDRIISSLHRQGHEVAFWYEMDEPKTAEQVAVPEAAAAWCVSELGDQEALACLRKWKPDVIYAHGLTNPALESEVLDIAPAVFFAHSYYGTCISGSKTVAFPKVSPCPRRFGPQCLLQYYPRRCGGLNPLTMWRDYRRQSLRLELLLRYRAIVTLSNHMVQEYVKHGFDPSRLFNLSSDAHSAINEVSAMSPERVMGQHYNGSRLDEFGDSAVYHLLFLGRMDRLKGGQVLFEALPHMCAKLNRPVLMTFAGDGPERKAWEKSAELLKTQGDRLRIEFVGWVLPREREELLRRCNLLVVPSLWPEPFGLVGLEANAHGVPVVAFDVGGINEWLWPGVNGFLAPGESATPGELAAAVAKCFASPNTYAALRRGAVAVAQKFSQRSHVLNLIAILHRASTDFSKTDSGDSPSGVNR